jgi:hypothetical protein
VGPAALRVNNLSRSVVEGRKELVAHTGKRVGRPLPHFDEESGTGCCPHGIVQVEN